MNRKFVSILLISICGLFLLQNCDESDCLMVHDPEASDKNFTISIPKNGKSFCGTCVDNCTADLKFEAEGEYEIKLENGETTFSCGTDDKTNAIALFLDYSDDAELGNDHDVALGITETLTGEYPYDESGTVLVTSPRSYSLTPSIETDGLVCSGGIESTSDEKPYKVTIERKGETASRYILETHPTENSDTVNFSMKIYQSDASSSIDCIENFVATENDDGYRVANCAFEPGAYYVRLETDFSSGAYAISLRDPNVDSDSCGASSEDIGDGSVADSAEDTDDSSSGASQLDLGCENQLVRTLEDPDLGFERDWFVFTIE